MIHTPFKLEDVLADRMPDDSLLEVPLTLRVFKMLTVLGIALAALVGAQVLNLAVFNHSFYEARAEANVTNVRREPAPRGIIRDRFGAALVLNQPSWSAVLVPRDLPKDAEARNFIVDRLASILGEDPARLRETIAAKDWSVSDRVVVSDELSQDALVTLSTESIPGVRLERSFQRVHADPLALSHLVGYVGRVNKSDLADDPSLHPENFMGRTGIEASYDAYLRGTDGRTVTYLNAHGEVQDAERREEPLQGAEVRTFVDGGLQTYLSERLARALRELGRTAGAAIAMDPRNGEVRAMVSFPSFDGTKIAKFLSAPGNPLFNRAVAGLYNPGSTIKPLVGVAALAEAVVVPETTIFSAGFIEVPNPYHPDLPSRFLDNKAHGEVDIRSALAKSSNIYFYEVAGGFEGQRGIGIERLKEWWKRFGLGDVTKIDLPGEKEGLLPDPAWKEKTRDEPWRVGDTYNVAIGQGDLLVTPLELLNYVSAIANGGTLWKPRVMRAVVDADGTVVATNEPEVRGDIRDAVKTALGPVREGMRDAVREPYGTAHSLANLPFAVAAKTGTAQIEGNTKLNAFFVGYAPAEEPELALLILVEDAREGSLNTVPVAHDVFLWYYNERIMNARLTH